MRESLLAPTMHLGTRRNSRSSLNKPTRAWAWHPAPSKEVIMIDTSNMTINQGWKRWSNKFKQTHPDDRLSIESFFLSLKSNIQRSVSQPASTSLWFIGPFCCNERTFPVYNLYSSRCKGAREVIDRIASFQRFHWRETGTGIVFSSIRIVIFGPRCSTLAKDGQQSLHVLN